MTAGNKCDGPGCGRFGGPGGVRWLYLLAQPEGPAIMQALGIGPASEPLTFCSLRCVAGYAYVAAVTTEAAAGSEPPPATGTGWPS